MSPSAQCRPDTVEVLVPSRHSCQTADESVTRSFSSDAEGCSPFQHPAPPTEMKSAPAAAVAQPAPSLCLTGASQCQPAHSQCAAEFRHLQSSSLYHQPSTVSRTPSTATTNIAAESTYTKLFCLHWVGWLGFNGIFWPVRIYRAFLNITVWLERELKGREEVERAAQERSTQVNMNTINQQR